MPRTLHDITPTARAMTDAELWRTIIFGALVGSPAVFVLTTLMALLATGLGNALAIAVGPAFFGGVFFGGTVPLMQYVHRLELADRADHHQIHVLSVAAREVPLAA